jgi:RNA polymerase sigma-70 factor (ECF subfamily)
MVITAAAIVGAAAAEDCVQDAWILVLRSLDRFEGRSSLKTWLHTITANAAKQRLGTRQRDELWLDRPSPHGSFDETRFDEDGHWRTPPALWDHDSPEALLVAHALQDCVDHTLDALPEVQSAILRLRDQEGLPLNELCNMLAVSHANARVLLHRARMKLFATIEHFEATGEC